MADNYSNKTLYQKINSDDPCFIIAEIGLNHNGDYELARQSVVAAAKAGGTAVKFQNFATEDFLTDRSVLYTYKDGDNEITEPLFDICKRSEFKNEWIVPLIELCEELGVEFLSTPTSEKGVDELIKNGVTILKNGSDYLTHLPLLRYMGQTGSTIILSTGMAYQDDIDAAVAAVNEAGKSSVILLHCTSSYPTSDENVNLCRMLNLKETYNVPIGFSDHTNGWISAVQAVTLGARVVEKHFTLDRTLPGPDHWFSSDPEEFAVLVQQIRLAERRLGCSALEPAKSELPARNEWRLGLVCARDISAGETISRQDIDIRKPARGLLSKDMDRVVGVKAKINLSKGDAIMEEHLI